MAIEFIPPIITAACGAYLLSQKKEKDSGNNTISEDKKQEIIDEYVLEEQKKEAAKDPRYKRTYFSNVIDEYDAFYDYSEEPDILNLLKNSSLNSVEKDKYVRSRIVSPFFVSSKSYQIVPDTSLLKKLGYDCCYCDGRIETGVIDNGYDGLSRLGFKGDFRYYSFVLELFNPYPNDTKIESIFFKKITIGDEDCIVYNNGGYYNEASKDLIQRTNEYIFAQKGVNYENKRNNITKKLINAWVNNPSWGEKINIVPGTKEFRYDIKTTIKAQSSAFVMIILPLAVTEESHIYNPKATNNWQLDLAPYFCYLYKQENYNEFDAIQGIESKTPFTASGSVVSILNELSSKIGDMVEDTIMPIGMDIANGVQYFISTKLRSPKEITNAFSAEFTIQICQDASLYTPFYEIGEDNTRPIKGRETKISMREGFGNNSIKDAENSYKGDYELYDKTGVLEVDKEIKKLAAGIELKDVSKINIG